MAKRIAQRNTEGIAGHGSAVSQEHDKECGRMKIKRLDRHKETRAKLAARLRSDRARESLRLQAGRMTAF